MRRPARPSRRPERHLLPLKDFDAVWLKPDPSSSLGINLRHVAGASDALARVFALFTPADISGG